MRAPSSPSATIGAVSQLDRIAWLVTVGICLVTALILLLSGYDGYAGVTLAVAIAAASTCLSDLARPHAVLGLEVDQHVGASRLDRVLQLVRGAVRLLERGAAANWTCRST